VADGTFDGYADDRNTVSIWDYASAALILREAGGAVVERDGRDLFDLSEPTGHRLLAASSPAQIDMLRRLLALRDASASPAGTSLSAP
jgi:fructose-1,6-bisphosphatase/inositol monophosphatase family enzyme